MSSDTAEDHKEKRVVSDEDEDDTDKNEESEEEEKPKKKKKKEKKDKKEKKSRPQRKKKVTKLFDSSEFDRKNKKHKKSKKEESDNSQSESEEEEEEEKIEEISEDEVETEPSDSDSSSKKNKKKNAKKSSKPKKKKKQKRKLKSKDTSKKNKKKKDESEDEAEDSEDSDDASYRGKLRRRKSSKNMREVEEDEEMVVEESEEESEEEEDSDENNDHCEECRGFGTLLCCSTCPKAYHLKCLDPPVEEMPPEEEDWFCPSCCCPVCHVGKFEETKGQEKHTCKRCERNFHTACAKMEKKRCPDCIKWPETVETILTHKEDENEKATEFYIKWKEMSHIHDCWVTYSWLSRICGIKVMNYLKKPNIRPQEVSDVVQLEWCEVERIVASRGDDPKEYMVKWSGLPYDQCTWETDMDNWPDAVKRYEAVCAKKIKPENPPERKETNFYELKNQPPTLTGKLLPYQLEGLNWLLYSWFCERNAILADEMGLGKTIQSISFLTHLYEAYGISPMLLVVPLSTVTNWGREFATWSPQMNVLCYMGSADARKTIREHEFYYPKTGKEKDSKSKGALKFQAVITSYEILLTDNAVLKKIPWRVLLVDEGHRLKNNEAKLFQCLKDYKSDYRILLTGTPIQNNLEELFNLFDFLGIDAIREFGTESADTLHQKEQLEKLHQLIRPHMLRRVKQDVLKSLPRKAEIVVPVSMSSYQKSFYQAILTKNYQYLNGAKKGSNKKVSLINILQQLLKCSNHPYLFRSEPETSSEEEEHKRLVEASGKLRLMDRMLEKLKQKGHRVLIFSQSTQMLDILEDYLTYKQHRFERIDGQVAVSNRQAAIDKFNAENSPVFCFLLSTRACRLGINLASADTVIFYDSDWNPHNDIQALSRAHRIGQTKPVMIFRLIVSNSAEERVIQTASKKLVLEHLVVQKMDQELKTSELEDILKYGTQQLFAENKEDEFEYDDAALEKLLDRSQATEDVENPNDENAAFLRSFNKARIWDVSKNNIPQEQLEAMQSDDYWRNLLQDRYLQMLAEEESAQSTGKRVRKQRFKLDQPEEKESDEEESEEEEKQASQSEEEDDDEWSASSEESNSDQDDSDDFSGELVPEQNPSQKKQRDLTSMEDKNQSPAAIMKSVTKVSGSGSSSIIVPLPAPTSNKKRKPEDDIQKRQEEEAKRLKLEAERRAQIQQAMHEAMLKRQREEFEMLSRKEYAVSVEIYRQQMAAHKQILREQEMIWKQQHLARQHDQYLLQQEINKQREAWKQHRGGGTVPNGQPVPAMVGSVKAVRLVQSGGMPRMLPQNQ